MEHTLKTDWEREATKAARPAFAAALQEIGLLDAFNNCTAAQIDGVIAVTVEAFQKSMNSRPAWTNDVPF